MVRVCAVPSICRDHFAWPFLQSSGPERAACLDFTCELCMGSPADFVPHKWLAVTWTGFFVVQILSVCVPFFFIQQCHLCAVHLGERESLPWVSPFTFWPSFAQAWHAKLASFAWQLWNRVEEFLSACMSLGNTSRYAWCKFCVFHMMYCFTHFLRWSCLSLMLSLLIKSKMLSSVQGSLHNSTK